MAGYEFAFGLDMSVNPAVAKQDRVVAAIQLGRDTGKLTASGQPLRIKAAKESVYLACAWPYTRVECLSIPWNSAESHTLVQSAPASMLKI